MTIAAITNGFHPSGEVVLEFKDVELGFDQHLVLRGISFRLHRGETKVLFGVAGSGKSVILKLAMGLLKPDAGTITVLGNEVSSMPEHELF
ncbi:MAG: organic solvent resistance ABC transporter ATP-binding protein, partial [Acidobacteria bacterium]